MVKKKHSGTLHSVADYLEMPYMHSVIPQSDGSFHGEIVELPGCIAIGDTPEEAYRELQEVAESWIEAAIEAGQTIPLPMECNDYSGKTVVRMPRGVHRKATIAAKREGVSLNQFIVSCIAQGIGGASGRARADEQSVFFSQFSPINAHSESTVNVLPVQGAILIAEVHSNA